MSQNPTPLSYARPAPESRHDMVYTALLGALVFFHLLGLVVLWWVWHSPTYPPESVPAMRMVTSLYVVLLLFEAAVLILRIAAPAHRQWPTVSLNVVLLLSFPFGTALGI